MTQTLLSFLPNVGVSFRPPWVISTPDGRGTGSVFLAESSRWLLPGRQSVDQWVLLRAPSLFTLAKSVHWFTCRWDWHRPFGAYLFLFDGALWDSWTSFTCYRHGLELKKWTWIFVRVWNIKLTSLERGHDRAPGLRMFPESTLTC